MKGKLVEIKIREVETSGHVYREAVIDEEHGIFLEVKGDVPAVQTFSYREYQSMHVRWPVRFHKAEECFFLQMDDRDIFNLLLKISEDTVASLELKATNKGYGLGIRSSEGRFWLWPRWKRFLWAITPARWWAW